MRCDEVTERLSLSLDGAVDPDEREQLDAHVATCPRCAAFERSALRVRQYLRYEVVADVPDVEARVFAALEREPERRGPARRASRFLAPAAALIAGAVAGAAFMGIRADNTSNVAGAAHLSTRVLAAQLRVDALDADVSVVERGWTADVPLRTYEGRLSYRAPESLTIQLDDTSTYPSKAWRPNDVTTVIDRDQAWHRGLAACPREAQPRCTPRQLRILGAVEREPFPDESPAPLDLIVPVRSFAGGGASASLGSRTIDGRRAIGVEVTVAQARPLLDGVLSNGNWRELHSTDRVRLWLEREHLIPLRVEVLPAPSAERERWAAHRGYDDDPNAAILELTLSHVHLGATAPVEFASAPPGTIEQAQGFRDDSDAQVTAPAPGYLPAGMQAYRSGVVETASGPVVSVRSWTDGRAWLKVRTTTQWPGGRLFGDITDPVAVDLGSAGTAYVGDGGRRVALHGPGIDVVVTGTVGEAALRRVTASLGVRGEPVPPSWPEAATARIDEVARALPGALLPRRLDGFSQPSIRIDGDLVTFELIGAGVRRVDLIEGRGTILSPPDDPDARGVRVRGTTGRFSPADGSLEWVEHDIIVTLQSDTLSLGELLHVAEQLRPA